MKFPTITADRHDCRWSGSNATCERSITNVWPQRPGAELAVLQAPIFDGLSFGPFSPLDDGIGAAEAGIGGRHIVQALVVAPVVAHRVRSDRWWDLGLQRLSARHER